MKAGHYIITKDKSLRLIIYTLRKMGDQPVAPTHHLIKRLKALKKPSKKTSSNNSFQESWDESDDPHFDGLELILYSID